MDEILHKIIHGLTNSMQRIEEADEDLKRFFTDLIIYLEEEHGENNDEASKR